MRSTVSVSQLLSLVDSATNVLCGAGISMIEPTGLPSGDRLRDLCVRGLLIDQSNEGIIDLLLESPSYQRLLPEAVLQEVGLFASSHVDRLMAKILGESVSNCAHVEIAARFPIIFTTNFDSCLEKAGARKVVHLHGAIDDPGSLQNRIFRLGKGRDQDIQLFESSLKGRPLLVLGYSLRDEDVMESIYRAKPEPILFLSYDGETPPYLASTSTPSFLAKGSVEELFSVRIPVGFTKAPLREIVIRRPPIGARASALLFLVYLAGLYELAPGVLSLYLPRLTGRTRYKAICSAADSLRIAGRYAEAIRLCESVLNSRLCKRSDQVDQLVTANNLLALCELDSGSNDYERAEFHFHQALDCLQKYRERHMTPNNAVGIEIFRARIENNLGLLYASRGEYSSAITAYMRSREVKLMHHDDRGVAQTDSNLAKCYLRASDYASAFQSLREVVRRMRKSPDRYICEDALSDLLPLLAETVGFKITLCTAKKRIDAETWTEVERRISPDNAGQLEILRELQELDRLYQEIYQI